MGQANPQAVTEKQKICDLYWEMANHYKLLLKIVTYSEILAALIAVSFMLYFGLSLLRVGNYESAKLLISVVATLCTGATLGVLVKKRDSYKSNLEDVTSKIHEHCTGAYKKRDGNKKSLKEAARKNEEAARENERDAANA